MTESGRGRPVAARTRHGGDALFGALLFAGALAPRLYVALAWASEPVWDGHYYDFGARRIAAGLGYSDDRVVAGAVIWHPWCHYPVGYSAFLAVFYRLFGASHAIAGVANALVGASLAVATWAVAAQALPRARARLAGLLVAAHPGLILYSALVMSEPLAAVLTLVAFWLVAREPRARRAAAAGGVLLGLATLVRPQALLCAPFLGLVRRASWRVRVEAAAVACAATLAVVAPWTARNCRVMDGCALVSTNGGWNLAIGAFPRATGRFETLRSSDGCRDVTGQVEQDRCWFAYGLAQIRAHPLRWLSLVPAKLGFTFDHESFAVEYLHEARPEDWPPPKREFTRELTTDAHRLLLAVSVLGCIAFPIGADRRAARTQGALIAMAAILAVAGASADSPAFWPLAVFAAVVPWLPLPGRPPLSVPLALAAVLLGTTLVTHAIFFGEDRYHVVVTPALALFAAAALRRRHGPSLRLERADLTSTAP